MQTPRGRPSFAVATTSSPLITIRGYARAAEATTHGNIDLDLTVSSLRRRLLGWDRLADQQIACVRIPARTEETRDLDPRGWHDWPERVVVDEERGPDNNGRVQLAAALSLHNSLSPATRVSLEIRPRNPDGGRSHLAALSNLRHIAEEWDLDLALDLTGPIDWLWEAEAAVSRLMPRLTIVRLIYPFPALDAQIRTRLTRRTLAACLDAGFSGLLSLVSPLPFWQWRNEEALARSTRIAIESLSSRYMLLSPSRWSNVPERSSRP